MIETGIGLDITGYKDVILANADRNWNIVLSLLN